MLFSDIIGQESVKTRLRQTVQDNRVSHAQLFLGPGGSGKLALAIAYAQYINCKNRTANDACGSCPSCIKYNKISHPDLHFVYPVARTKRIKDKPRSKDFASEWRELLLDSQSYFNLNRWYEKIGIENKQAIINAEDCNEIIKTLSYKSYESEYKVMIIWMAEKLYYSAAPKILKILEEPPEKTLFILISENQDQIINTIRSRTQIIKIPKLKEEDIRNGLAVIPGMDQAESAKIAMLAEGNFVEALDMARSNGDEQEHFERFVNWMRLCFSFKIPDINNFVSEISKIGRERQKAFLSFAMRISRNSILLNMHLKSIVPMDEQEAAFMKRFVPYVNPANGSEFYQELNKGIRHIERNANPSILFMDLSLKISLLLRMVKK